MSAAPLSLLAAALVGAALGGVYLSLLWAAVKRLPRSPDGIAVFITLGAARAVLLLGALAAAAALGVPASGFVAALSGFIVVRLATTRQLRRGPPADSPWR